MRASQRPRRTQMRQTEPPKPQNTTQTFLDSWGQNLVRNQELFAEEGSKGLGTGALDALIRHGQTEDSGWKRAAAFGGDVLTDPLALSGIGAAMFGGKAAANAAKTYRSMPQANQELFRNAIMNRLYHGTRGGAFDVASQGGRVRQNLFGANFFTTPSRSLAQTSGYGAGTAHRVSGLGLDDVARMNILDLYPGAPSIRDQFPALADDLLKMGIGVNDLAAQGGRNITKDVGMLQQALNNPARFRNFDDPALRSLFVEQGIDAIRHQSGRVLGGSEAIYQPVYALFNPRNLRATPARPTFDQAMENAMVGLGSTVKNAPNQLRSIMNRIFRGTPSEYTPPPNPGFGRKRVLPVDDPTLPGI